MAELVRNGSARIRPATGALDATPLSVIMDALSDPIRLRIVRMLLDQGEIACGGFNLDAPKSTLSHHFKVLREAGIISKREEGTRIYNALCSEEIEQRCPGLLQMIASSDGPW